MDVLLVNPPWKHGYNRASRWGSKHLGGAISPPLYLMYAAAVLEERGFKVSLIDAVASGLSFDEYAAELRRLSPRVVVIESTTPSFPFDLNSAKVAKEAGAEVVIVGSHPSVFPLDVLRGYREVDVCGIGEYDYTVADVSEALVESKPLDEVRGIAFRGEDGGVKETLRRAPIDDLDRLPYPARHLVPMDRYVEPVIMNHPFATEITSRGCPYQCIFCLYPATMYGRRFRARSPKSVVDEMEFLVERYGAKEIFFDDDTFTINRKRVMDICREMKGKKLDVAWSCLSRVNTVNKEELKTMADVGCILIRYGVETGSQELLDLAKKGITIEQIRNAFRWSREVGIRTHATMMFGLPGDSLENIRKTMDFVRELDPDFAQFAIATPYPGTEFYKLVGEKGWLKAENWGDFVASGKAVVETDSLRAEDLENAIIEAYKEFYLRPTYILKRIRNIRSLCELRKTLNEATVLFKSLFFEGSY